jgi:WW domain
MGQPPPQVHENSKIIPGSSRKDYNMCKDIDVELFNIFWDNTTCRIRALNVYELSVNKHLQNVQKYTFIHLVQYDHCYTEEMLRNPTERMNYLRRLVAIQWLRPKYIDQRNKAYDQGIRFEENSLHHPEDIEDLYRNTAHHIDRIVHYIDTQYQNIVYDLPYDHFTNGHLQYVPLPQFANLHNVGSLTTDDITNTDRARMMTNVPFLEYADTPVPCHPDDILPHPWITNITNSGKTYYWNPVTRVSSWIRPSPVVNN